MQDDFKNINDATPSLPFDDVWAGLKPELDKEAARREKHKRRFIIFWLSLAIIGFGGGALFVFYRPSSIADSVVKGNEMKKISNKEQGILNDDIEKKQSTLKVEKQILYSEKRIMNNEQGILNVEAEKQKNKLRNEFELLNKKPKKGSKKQFISSNGDVFKSVKSFTNLSEYKKENELIYTNKNSANVFINNEKNNLYNASNSVTVTDTATSSKDSTVIKFTVANSINTSKKPSSKLKKTSKLNYGLLWNFPIQNGVNLLDINATKQPTTLFIPEVWISKTFAKKHSLTLAFNPYSQYSFNNKAVIDFNKYNVTINTGSQAITKPQDITYTEAIAFNKLIAIEASLMYQYQLSSKIKIGAGISNNWTQVALMQNKVIKNYVLTTRDSLYGVDKSSKEWSYLNSTYLLGKFEVQYQIKKINIGVCFRKPISNVFVSNNQYKTPINTNIFVRWSIK